jgi:hypothetical protein
LQWAFDAFWCSLNGVWTSLDLRVMVYPYLFSKLQFTAPTLTL